MGSPSLKNISDYKPHIEQLLLKSAWGQAEQVFTTKAVKRDPYGVWLECKLIQPLCETLWRFLRKVKIESLYDPVINNLGIYLKKMKALILTPLFIAALFIIAKVRKQPNCPLVNDWDETDLEYICTRCYSVKKKKKFAIGPGKVLCLVK